MTAADVIAGLKRAPVAVSAGGLDLLVKPWTAKTRAEFATWREANPGPGSIAAKVFQVSVCDAAGALLFADVSIEEINELDGAAVEVIADRVMALSGLGKSDPGNS